MDECFVTMDLRIPRYHNEMARTNQVFAENTGVQCGVRQRKRREIRNKLTPAPAKVARYRAAALGLNR